MIIFILFYLIYFIYSSTEVLHMIQQNLYNENNRYLKWTKNNFKDIFIKTDLLPIIIFFGLLLRYDKDTIDVILIACTFIYGLSLYLEYQKNKSNQNKIPLKSTLRIKILFFTTLLIYAIIFYFLNKYHLKNMVVELSLLVLTGLLIAFRYYTIYLANLIDKPINSIIYKYYLSKAKKKLKEHHNLSVVGITGSYGKTSCKNILKGILDSKYITRETPKNFNTPNGLMITINNYLDKFDEVFIAEMGAYRPGRIKNLCNFVHPKYGILTVIGEAHLESFGSIENIQKTKFELIESLPSDGVAVLNRDDELQVNYELKNKVKVIWIGVNNHDADIYATDINCSHRGTTFICHYYGEKIKLTTRLLGNHNVYNILSAVALGLYMNIDINDIKAAVMGLQATPHRLELKKMDNFYMLDDAYNSNPVGASSALEVLNKMPGLKVVVTPGMVELGKKEKEENYKFGQKMAKYTNYVILVGEKKTKEIYNGLIEEGFNEDNIFVTNRVTDAYNIVKALKEEDKELYALFENDLPDIYSEVK